MSSFEQFGLPPSILKPLTGMNFLVPTPIQEQAIPFGLAGRDVVGLAQTGTGKTAAFVIPLLVRLMNNPEENALVLSPTRELAIQIHDFVRELAGKNFNLDSALLIGGTSLKLQHKQLRNRPRILIATPGRLVDHLQNFDSKLLARSSILVLDEADRMLDMGFMPQLRVILRSIPQKRQTMMFSATFAPEIRKLADQYLNQPAQVSVGTPSRPIEKIEQKLVHTTQKEKNDLLTDELNDRQGSVLIFTRTKHRADRLCKFLDDCGYSVTRIHGNRTQSQRQLAIEGFREGKFRILVATDIAARGLDIPDIGHVVCFDLPQVPEDYIHRIGRTARNGKGGEALAFITPEDRAMWNAIVKVGKFDASMIKTAGTASTAAPSADGERQRAPGYSRQARGPARSGRPTGGAGRPGGGRFGRGGGGAGRDSRSARDARPYGGDSRVAREGRPDSRPNRDSRNFGGETRPGRETRPFDRDSRPARPARPAGPREERGGAAPAKPSFFDRFKRAVGGGNARPQEREDRDEREERRDKKAPGARPAGRAKFSGRTGGPGRPGGASRPGSRPGGPSRPSAKRARY